MCTFWFIKHATVKLFSYEACYSLKCWNVKMNTVSNTLVLHSEIIRWKLTSILFFLLCPLDKPGNKKHPQTSSTSLTLSDTTQRSLHFIWTGKTKTPTERKREFLQGSVGRPSVQLWEFREVVSSFCWLYTLFSFRLCLSVSDTN